MSSSTGCRRRLLFKLSDCSEQPDSERKIDTKLATGLFYHVSTLILWFKELRSAPENLIGLSATVASCSILLEQCVSGNVEA
jgi:hypothetical protein